MEKIENPEQLKEAFELALEIQNQKGTLVSAHFHRGEVQVIITTPKEHCTFYIIGKQEYKVRNESELCVLRALKQELESGIVDSLELKKFCPES